MRLRFSTTTGSPGTAWMCLAPGSVRSKPSSSSAMRTPREPMRSNDTVDTGILYLSRRDVIDAAREIDAPSVIARALRQHARGQAVVPDEAYLRWTSPTGGAARSLNMPGYLAGETPVAGTKVIN